jgi:hypothetical protein
VDRMDNYARSHKQLRKMQGNMTSKVVLPVSGGIFWRN